MISPLPSYIALALQRTCKAVNKYAAHAEVREHITNELNHLATQIFASKKFIGEKLKLVVLPEYFLTSFPMRENIQAWRDKACLYRTDPLFDLIGDICKKNSIYFSGNYYERDDAFPDLFFQASFIIDDEGKMILNYRRLNSMYSPTPHDVLDKYIAVNGYESLFPVAKTKLGNLACIASEEILYPEVARCLMMNGAEVFLHSSSEIGSPLQTKKNVAKLARAIENMAYVVSANSAGIVDYPIPAGSTDGGSKVINYDGITLAEALPGESIVAHAYIHIPALRDYRETVGMKNYIARQRFELYAEKYKNTVHYPANSFAHETPDKARFGQIQQEVIRRIYAK